MTTKLTAMLFIATIAFCAGAMADNTLTTDQLVKSIQSSVTQNNAAQPDMAKSTSGLRTTTVGTTAQVTILMDADGMSMSAKYLCVPQGADMACNVQQ